MKSNILFFIVAIYLFTAFGTARAVDMNFTPQDQIISLSDFDSSTSSDPAPPSEQSEEEEDVEGKKFWDEATHYAFEYDHQSLKNSFTIFYQQPVLEFFPQRHFKPPKV